MILNINNFMRLCIALNIALFSIVTHGEELNYEFHWFYAPVAKLSISFKKSSTDQYNNKTPEKKFKLITQGPLKLYRNYSSVGSITRNNNKWDYHLLGQDRGQTEEKLIIYFSDKAPKIKKFIDDDDVLPVTIDPQIDKGAIDPFSVLYETIEQLSSIQQCNQEYLVMDGKRRYRVKVKLINKKGADISRFSIDNDDIVFNCLFSLSELEEENKRWPFNKKNRSMNVWFSSNLNFRPIRFYFKTPIGKIVGNIVND